MDKYGHAKERTIEWSSSAYKNQSFQFLDAEGRLFVDLLPLVKRDYKMNNYQLKTIASHFLKDITKDPLDAKGIFKCYRLGMKGGEKGRKALSLVGTYCVKDSELVVRLFETLTTWVGLCEMSKVTNVPIFMLYTQGQQLKVFSQVYRKATHENIVVEKDAYLTKDTDHYMGATVFPPVPGVYEKVVPMDFSSLYPTTIIANNICWSTLVVDDTIPNELCNVMEWDEHSGCCVSGDALVSLPTCSITLENLAGVQDVLSYDIEKKGVVSMAKTKFYNQGVKQCVKVLLEDGTELVCTPDHRILTVENEWVEAGNLLGKTVHVYQEILGTSQVVRVDDAGFRPVYDIEVPGTHNFIANGLVVHNCHDPKEIRKTELGNIIKQKETEIRELRKLRDEKKNKNKKQEFAEKILEMKEKIRPFREERSQLQKSKNKHVSCCTRKYRWLKKPMGVLPEILTHLLETRASTKKEMKNVKGQLKECKEGTEKYLELSTYYEVLDQRQLALKVSANSAYGAMGVRRGYLPFMPGAMATTYKGRMAIEKAAESIQKDWKGKLIYGDTDSNYVSFPHLSSPQEIWDYALKVASEVSRLFPKPMSLAFEEKIYLKFLLLTKKRYMSLACERDGIPDTKISKKGVLLSRRDNSPFVRKVYGDVIMKIFNKESMHDILFYILEELNKLCSASYSLNDFVITKSVGDVGDLEPRPGVDKNGKACQKVGDYTVKLLPEDPEKRKQQYKLKECNTPKQYYLRCLPAQAQLAEKMRERGMLVSAGTRLEYVITTNGGHNAKQYTKIESVEYFSSHSASLQLDYLYYLKQLTNPMDQVLDVIYGGEPGFKKGFMLEQYKARLQKKKILDQVCALVSPKLNFE
jgi:DNA polymerase elongation subunit (family B)